GLTMETLIPFPKSFLLREDGLRTSRPRSISWQAFGKTKRNRHFPIAVLSARSECNSRTPRPAAGCLDHSTVKFLIRSVMLGMGHRRRVQPCLALSVPDFCQLHCYDSQ